MMYSDELCSNLISVLKKSEMLADKKIIEAYPYCAKPTRLEKDVITLSVSSGNYKAVSIGEEVYAGSVTVNISVFISYRKNLTQIYEVTKEILDALSGTYPTAISLSDVTVDENADAFKAVCSLTYPVETV